MKGALIIAGLALARSDWVLTFEDDFSGNTLNTTSWTVADRDPTKSQYDGHDAMFVKENVAVSNGNLIITTSYGGYRATGRDGSISYAHKNSSTLTPTAPNSTLNGVKYNMLSGWIDSQQKRNQTILGQSTRFEASLRMPDANATGAWPAWWLLPEGLVRQWPRFQRRRSVSVVLSPTSPLLACSAGRSAAKLTLSSGTLVKATSRKAIPTSPFLPLRATTVRKERGGGC